VLKPGNFIEQDAQKGVGKGNNRQRPLELSAHAETRRFENCNSWW
jgi:hypothetical protein